MLCLQLDVIELLRIATDEVKQGHTQEALFFVCRARHVLEQLRVQELDAERARLVSVRLVRN